MYIVNNIFIGIIPLICKHMYKFKQVQGENTKTKVTTTSFTRLSL